MLFRLLVLTFIFDYLWVMSITKVDCDLSRTRFEVVSMKAAVSIFTFSLPFEVLVIASIMVVTPVTLPILVRLSNSSSTISILGVKTSIMGAPPVVLTFSLRVSSAATVL